MKPCFFVHIPKTAGQSIKSFMRKTTYGHVRYLDAPKNVFSFSFVRNPLDRLVSVFFFNRGNYRQYADHMKAKNDFKDFVNKLKPQKIKMNLNTNKGIIPQYWWLIDKSKEIGVDFVGKFENLKKDYKKVAERINISKLLPKKKFNKSNHKHFSKYYDKDLEEKVKSMYQKDFELFYEELL